MGSISERAEGREPREGPKLGMATGMPVSKEYLDEKINKDAVKQIKKGWFPTGIYVCQLYMESRKCLGFI